MTDPDRPPLAWVESPLQLLGAAELAASRGILIRVAFRLSGEQMTTTAAELLRRGAPFTVAEPYFGIPWSLLSGHRDWVIGDAFSGQFRSAMTLLRPRSVTLVDDGAMSIHVAEALAGCVDYSRPGQHESGLKTVLGGRARDRMLRLTSTGGLRMFSAFADHASLTTLRTRGIMVTQNDFSWSRTHARPMAIPEGRVVLGSAAVQDGALAPERYLAWLRGVAAEGPAAYLPHRREPLDALRAVGAIDGLTVRLSGLPVELALAGIAEPLEVVSLRSTAAITLRQVLEGSGSSIRLEVAA